MNERYGGIIRRAFELAETMPNIDQIKQQLHFEGYEQVEAHFGGKQLRSDLNAIIEKRQAT